MANETNTAMKKIRMKEKFGKWISETPLFHTLSEKAKTYFQNPEQLNREVTEFYNKATHETGEKTIVDMWHKVQVLFRMVRESLKNNYHNLPKAKVIAGVAVLLYLVMPADLIPDFVPVFGFADDFALLAWFIRSAAEEVQRFQEWEGSQVQAHG